MHLHYDLPYPDRDSQSNGSFFEHKPDSEERFWPKDPIVHKPLTLKQVLNRRLHWVTLGGQYDWANRVYPEEKAPQFPPDIEGLLGELFPETLAQAAIVNFYSPGDTMMLHRDVSEEVNKGLISLSFGCDCLFMIAPSGLERSNPERNANTSSEKKYLLLKLRSGDALYMTEASRYAWHGVPKVMKATCPQELEDWPATNGKFGSWRGWLKDKRINLNVRQVHG